jgi:SAM-dependent methyltransferase
VRFKVSRQISPATKVSSSSMSHNSRYVENLPQLAAEAYELSGRLCGTCGDLHALWTYIRLSRASIGVPDQASGLETQLSDLFAGGRRDVLIAGSQDTGLLALTARAGADHGVSIVVLDICETPLELCRRFAQKWSLPIKTVRQDLLDLDIERRFDVVLVHCTLQFIAADRRATALVRMRRAIRPGGRLVLFFNTSRPIVGEFAREGRAGYPSWVLDELKRLDVALPDTEAAMRERFETHSRHRETREGKYAEPGEVEALLDASGFNVRSCTRVEVKVASPMDSFLAKVSMRQFMAIAEPQSAS